MLAIVQRRAAAKHSISAPVRFTCRPEEAEIPRQRSRCGCIRCASVRTLKGGESMGRVGAGVFLFLVFATTAAAQTFRGGINGSVTDQTGAVVPSAEVKATNDATGLSYSTTSSTAGEFAFSDLPLGDYTVVVSLGGFETFRISRV